MARFVGRRYGGRCGRSFAAGTSTGCWLRPAIGQRIGFLTWTNAPDCQLWGWSAPASWLG
jgi:hypothetical protein